MNETADAERLAAIRARREKVQGPWYRDGRDVFSERKYVYNEDQADLIAHAPEDITYLLSVATERDAQKKRAEQAESALLEVEDRLRAPGYGTSDSNRIALLHIESWRSGTARVRLSPEAELDALRARIEAAPHAYECPRWGWEQLSAQRRARSGMKTPKCKCWKAAALAGDQPEVIPDRETPQGCDCDPREATLDAEMRVVCAECGAVLDQPEATPEQSHDPDCTCDLDDMATPEPPYLDPEPWACGRDRSARRWRPEMRFAPRPADENGKAYSDNREDYERGTV